MRRLTAGDGLLDAPIGEMPSLAGADIAGARSVVTVLRHVARFTYSGQVSRVTQRLIVVPRRRHGDQQRIAHRFRVLVDDAEHPVDLRTEVDRLGNTVMLSRVDAATSTLTYETRAVVSRVRDGGVPMPWAVGEETGALVEADSELAAAAGSVCATAPLEAGVELMHLVAREMHYRPGVTSVSTTAGQAWRLRAGVCQDLAHVLIAMCRCRGVAARYVSGHLLGEGASHAWVEVCDPATGRVLALDPTHDRPTDLRYLTTAVGREYRDVPPTLGTAWTSRGPGVLRIEKQLRVVRAR